MVTEDKNRQQGHAAYVTVDNAFKQQIATSRCGSATAATTATTNNNNDNITYNNNNNKNDDGNNTHKLQQAVPQPRFSAWFKMSRRLVKLHDGVLFQHSVQLLLERLGGWVLQSESCDALSKPHLY